VAQPARKADNNTNAGGQTFRNIMRVDLIAMSQNNE
jgi:hypothetical protein